MQCPDCGAHRFTYGEGKNNVIPKAFPYVYFGIRHQIAALFSNKQWAQHFDTPDKNLMPYFESPEYQRLCRALEERHLDINKCVLIEIGHDGFNPFKGTSWRQTWGFWMKVKNTNPTIAYRYMNVKEVALLPRSTRFRQDGLHLQVCWSTAWEAILDELAGLCIPG